jgi:signal transduction histidine kinase
MAENATDELRRLCKGLRPPLLDDLGLVAAIRLLVDEFREHSGLEVGLELPNNERKLAQNDVVVLTAYRILQESLTNVRRHANARTVTISLIITSVTLTMSITDDGCGFDIAGLNGGQGCGLEGMRERANLAGGRVDINAAPGNGTRVVFSAPLHGEKSS